VYVLDTLGELSHCYQYAEAAFIGGTILSTGHNVIEPVLWGKPVSYGPLRGHFEDLQLLCERFGVGFRCFTTDDLAAHWIAALSESFHNDVQTKAIEMLARERGATQKTLDVILPLIPRPSV
jgi:3-deoxy-D-manno-octulosonic-acid transferase